MLSADFFRRFKIFDCPHCNDKFCTQDDMERHLAKVERNNAVDGVAKPELTFTEGIAGKTWLPVAGLNDHMSSVTIVH